MRRSMLITLAAGAVSLAPAVRAAELNSVTLTCNGSGSVGSATCTATSSVLIGYLEDIQITHTAAGTASTDVTIAYGTAGRGNLLATSNSTASVFAAPRVKPVDNANAAITDAYDRYPLYDKVIVTLAQGTAATPSVTVVLRYFKP